ncbi:MAG: PEP-CTERM sorting domain-containing protein [Candidatus Schekmanbacteria bacterium]|nr:PEP-CTERM sorting domain-containing protein [Candidatus Schekmanbacteria bacterium]
MKAKFFIIMAVLAVACWAPGASATTTFGFFCITNNSAVDAATAGQFFVDVSDPAGDHNVLFTFRNVGPAASFIDGVYFDDGTLLGISEVNVGNVVVPGGSVAFSPLANPSDLPGRNNISPAFQTTQNFSADNDPGAVNGVNPGEAFGIQFNLISGQGFVDTLEALANGTLRIGIHVQGFEGGGSESFVNKVPVPPTAILLGSGLLGLGLLGWRRKKK